MSGEKAVAKARSLEQIIGAMESDLDNFKGLMLTSSMANKQKDTAVEFLEKMIEYLKAEQKGQS